METLVWMFLTIISRYCDIHEKMTHRYHCLDQQVFKKFPYELVPIRAEDRLLIMQWRNEQMYHLRQKNILTQADQDHYFKTVVEPAFSQSFPNQVLFSFLENGVCIGYGGLVHIDWEVRSAEISFLMQTDREAEEFERLWSIYLSLIEWVAFDHLQLQRIFTYSYELRPRLYPILDRKGFHEEKRIPREILLDDQWIDALIHGKKNLNFNYRKVLQVDEKLIFQWANDPLTRFSSINSEEILWEDHQRWFQKKLLDPSVQMYVFQYGQTPVGQVRLEPRNQGLLISFVVSPAHRGQGIGFRMISEITHIFSSEIFIADVLKQNQASHRIFKQNEFKVLEHYVQGDQKITRYQKTSHGAL